MRSDAVVPDDKAEEYLGKLNAEPEGSLYNI